MKLHLVTPACTRVQAALDQALTTGDLRLPPELQAHLGHCPTCAAAADATQELLRRLRSAAAALPLTNLPGAVSTVLDQTRPNAQGRNRLDPAWFLGQLASLAGLLLLLVCLLLGLGALVLHLLGTAVQATWQPAAQALVTSPSVSVLLERETHFLLLWDYFKWLRVKTNPPQGAAAPAGVPL